MHAILTLICFFIVTNTSTQKYITSIGQNTGISVNVKQVANSAYNMAFVADNLK